MGTHTLRRSRRLSLLWALTCASVAAFTSLPARAENALIDCGSRAGYEKYSPWPALKGCSTRLGQATVAGPTFPNTASILKNSWLLGGDVGSPVVSADGTIHVVGGTTLYSFPKTGSRTPINLVDVILGTPAIGADGTIYVPVSGSFAGLRSARLVAIDPVTRATKWSYQMTFGSLNPGSPAIGADGAVYAVDQAGNLHAVKPDSTAKWPYKYMFGSVNTSPVLSRDGQFLYIGNDLMQFRAVRTSDGSQAWLSPVATGNGSTATIGEDGTIYVASSLGILYALDPSDGTSKWQRLLSHDGITISNVIASPSFTPKGDLIVGTANGWLYSIRPGASSSTEVWKSNIGTGLVSSPIVDRNGTIFIGTSNSVGEFKALSSDNGDAYWSYSTGGQIWSTAAVTASGEVIFGSNDDRLYRTIAGPGGSSLNADLLQPNDDLNQDPVYDGGVAPNYMQTYCTNPSISLVLGEKRPGVDYLEWPVVLRPDLEFITDFTTDPSFTDPDCKAVLCDDNEVPLVDQTTLLGSPAGFPPAGATDDCDIVDPPAACPGDRSKVKWSESCEPAGPNTCGAGSRCMYVCPAVNPSSPTSLPQAQCEPNEELKRCVTETTKNCTGLPGPQDPERPVSACHELRECARDDDLISTAEATPTCSDSCDATFPPQGPQNSGASGPTMPSLGLWDASGKATLCKLVNGENSTATNESGADPNSGGAPKNKKWGVNANTDMSSDYHVNPMGSGFFLPHAEAHGLLSLSGLVMGRNIPVVRLYGDAVMGTESKPCEMYAQGGVELFGQKIAGAVEGGDTATANEGACNTFFAYIDETVGGVKNFLYQGLRAYDLVRLQNDTWNPTAGAVRVSSEICAKTLSPAECDGAPSPALYAKALNKYVTDYKDKVNGLATALGNLQSERFGDFTEALDGFDTNSQQLAKNIDFVDLGEDFSIGAAGAYFPIGPITISLEIRGFGNWGVKGGIQMGAKFFPVGSPKVWAEAAAVPSAKLFVDVFVGAGFEFGIAGASVGIGGNILLVGIDAPIFSRVELGGTTPPSYTEARGLPSDLEIEPGALVSGTPYLDTGALTKKVAWNLQTKFGAGANLNFLSGTIDLRLRVRFLFFSKTWKKRVAKFEGFQKSYSWTGTLDLGLAEGLDMPDFPGDLDVLPSLPFPNFAAFPATMFASDTAWESQSAMTLLSPEVRSAMQKLASFSPGLCEAEPFQ